MAENMNKSDTAKQAQLYFDGACPLCRREIALVRRLARAVEFIDVHQLQDDELPEGTDRAALLRDLHFRFPDGRVDTGLEANIALWQATPLGGLWRVLNLPLVRPLALRVYRRWADRRFARMGYCALLNRPDTQSACGAPPLQHGKRS